LRLQTKLGKKTLLYAINPKAITVSELYGVLDPDTRDWTDGLLSSIFREINKPLPPEKDEARCVGVHCSFCNSCCSCLLALTHFAFKPTHSSCLA